MNQPLLHVMIPAYGESPHLEETLTSACENLSESVLITVLEDPSEVNVIESITSKFKLRVNFQKNNERLGIANNFNKCLELSQGKFTQICGHDDLIIKDPTNILKKTGCVTLLSFFKFLPCFTVLSARFLTGCWSLLVGPPRCIVSSIKVIIWLPLIIVFFVFRLTCILYAFIIQTHLYTHLIIHNIWGGWLKHHHHYSN